MRKMVAAVIFRHDGKFLVLKRKLSWVGWEFVKGRVEKGTHKDAARREVREETGLKVSIITKLPPQIIYHHRKIDEQKVSVQKGYLAQYLSGDVKLSSEHNDYKWVNAAQARKMLTHISHRTFLKAAVEFLRGYEKKWKNSIISELSKKHVTHVRYDGEFISLRYDGARLRNKAVKKRVKDIGDWSKAKKEVYYDRNLHEKTILPILIHETVEKYVTQKYGLKVDTESHKIATAVEKEFIADKPWIGHQRRVTSAWVKTNKRKVGKTKFF